MAPCMFSFSRQGVFVLLSLLLLATGVVTATTSSTTSSADDEVASSSSIISNNNMNKTFLLGVSVDNTTAVVTAPASATTLSTTAKEDLDEVVTSTTLKDIVCSPSMSDQFSSLCNLFNETTDLRKKIVNSNDGIFSSRLSVGSSAEIDWKINSNEQFTLFAPVNTAFNGQSLDVLLPPGLSIDDFLSTHVVQRSLSPFELSRNCGTSIPTRFNGETTRTICGANGLPIYQVGEGNVNADRPQFIDRSVIRRFNGYIYGIDNFIRPSQFNNIPTNKPTNRPPTNRPPTNRPPTESQRPSLRPTLSRCASLCEAEGARKTRLRADTTATDFAEYIFDFNVNGKAGSTAGRIFGNDINCWDVSAVQNMQFAYGNNSNSDNRSFENRIDCWDVSSVTSFESMFFQSVFNGVISDWNVSSAVTFDGMFFLSDFNGVIRDWDVSSAVTFDVMFGASVFNGVISDWDVSSATNFGGMFAENNAFNGVISDWNVSSATSFEIMFAVNNVFNGNISDWNVSSATSFEGMFGDSVFNGNISDWDVSSATNFGGMFAENNAFNRDINDWDVSSATSFEGMFQENDAFNRDISKWNVKSGTSFQSMFELSVFNRDISRWNVKSGTTFKNMFLSAKKFQQNLCAWGKRMRNTASVNSMFKNSGCVNKKTPTSPFAESKRFCETCE